MDIGRATRMSKQRSELRIRGDCVSNRLLLLVMSAKADISEKVPYSSHVVKHACMRRHMDIGRATRMSKQRSELRIRGDCVSNRLLLLVMSAKADISVKVPYSSHVVKHLHIL
ncbi:MAG: hypothetical protein SOY73_00195 [Blautia sp.]|nr:hypothetical protein [Blautia sp.]